VSGARVARGMGQVVADERGVEHAKYRGKARLRVTGSQS
jgi:hypothetical protein